MEGADPAKHLETSGPPVPVLAGTLTCCPGAWVACDNDGQEVHHITMSPYCSHTSPPPNFLVTEWGERTGARTPRRRCGTISSDPETNAASAANRRTILVSAGPRCSRPAKSLYAKERTKANCDNVGEGEDTTTITTTPPLQLRYSGVFSVRRQP